jgi:hypothetical protein
LETEAQPNPGAFLPKPISIGEVPRQENPIREKLIFCAVIAVTLKSALPVVYSFHPNNSARRMREKRTIIVIRVPEQSRQGSAHTFVSFSLQQPRIDFQN